MKITMPLPPNLGNARLHWAKKHKLRKAYNGKCDTLQLLGEIPRPPREPMRGRISAAFYVWSMQDIDNLFSRAKWTVDWLVTRGYLAGDSPRDIEWAGIPEQRVDRQHQRIEITITPVGEREEAA